jgi:hypothetical protein
MKDLVVLTADTNMEFAVRGILGRSKSLNTRGIEFDIFPHPQKDPGVYKRSHDFLRSQQDNYRYGITVFDKDGCGSDDDADIIAGQVQNNLDSAGWRDRSAVIVIVPELEIWVWSDSPEVARCLGWDNDELRNWLCSKGYLKSGEIKPRDPKEAVEKALFAKRKPMSSSIFLNIASAVSFDRCSDDAFARLRQTLQEWFPAE